MKQLKADRLRAAGWKVGDARGFLKLSEEEACLIELKLAFANFLHTERRRRDLTQSALAKKIGSSQSRIAKIEAGDASVSLDLMFRTALCLGASLREVGRAISRAGHLPNRSRKASQRFGFTTSDHRRRIRLSN